MRQTALLLAALLAAQPAIAAPFAGAATGPAVASQGTAETYRLDSGEVFNGAYLADYWSRNRDDPRGDNPSADAPGRLISSKPVFGGDLKQPAVQAVRRKLEALNTLLLAHPTLARIRGGSIAPGGGFYHERGGPLGHAVPGTLTINVYPIALDNKKTIKFADGTHHTPGEADSIRISVNDTDLLEGRAPIGEWNGMPVVQRGGSYMLVISNSERPLFVEEGTGAGAQLVMNPNLIDKSRPRSDIQFMTVYVGTSRPIRTEIERGRLSPLSPAGRLVGMMFNTDWPALMRQVDAM